MIRNLRFMLEKEFRQILRDPGILRVIFLMPAMQLLVLPWAADYEVKNVKLALVDLDHSTMSRDLVWDITASGYFRLEASVASYNQALDKVAMGKADLVLTIPAGFEKDLIRDDKARLGISLDAVNGVKAGLAGNYMQAIIRRFNQDIRVEWLRPPKFPQQQQISVIPINWYNPEMDYKHFMVPGILVLLLTMVGANLAALNIIKEKELGTIEQLNVTPLSKVAFILGKLIPFWVLGLFMLTIGLTIAWAAYGILPQGSFVTIYLFAGLYLMAVLGMGLLISTYAATQQQAMLISFFLMMIFVLMSGLYTSIESMPPWAQWITRFNPVTYFVDVMRKVVLKGSGLRDIAPQMAIVGSFAVFLNTWAVLNYRKRQ
jgi:ABC-2 type transport system permease protein